MATATSSVIDFLKAKKSKAEHNGPDLLERFLRYGCDMEVQVNVSAGEGEPVADKRSTYTDGINTWFSYRIPRNADSKPEFRDYKIDFPLDRHAVGIGSTGWDWVAGRSRWVGFDFDSIVGHAAGVGVTKESLDKVKEAAQALPYVEARKSTGGAGLHLYVLFDDGGIPTANHTEHAALARCILGVMSRDAGFDFQTQIDGCGGNMWIWHTKSKPTNEGLKLIKAIERPFTLGELPGNWRDNIEVVTRRRAKVKLSGIDSEVEEDLFDQLATAHRRISLDAKHKAMIDRIAEMGIVCTWVGDHHLLQTHTIGFQKLMAEYKDELQLQGVFQTNSKGGDLATPNVFGFPMDHGGWRLFRFGNGCVEAATWEQDGKGWTTCGFNIRPSLKVAARSLGGRELSKGGFEFDSLEIAARVAEALNPESKIEVDEKLKDRKAVVRKTKEGKLAIEITKDKRDPDSMGEWNNSDKKSAWTQVFNVSSEPVKSDVADYDEQIRRLETINRQSAGWSMKKRDNDWTQASAGEIKTILQHLGHPKPEAEQIMGNYTQQPWKLVMLPFQPEYPGNRQWNLDAPQYRFQPVSRTDFESVVGSAHPHWDIVLNHIGNDLTSSLKNLEWAKSVGIRTGGDYLRAIFASILREPYTPTPYLFLFGPENSGKSIIHEAFNILVTRGVVKADRSLTNQSNFNGELDGAIFCVVEETDLTKASGSLEKIKDAVTSPRLSIRKMRTDSYMTDNMTHWVQCAQKSDMVPTFEGDTRITMIYVPRPEADIPKSVLMERLEAEAPYFMRTLMDLELPPVMGRLRVPFVDTPHKQRAQMLNRSPVETFVKDNLHEAPGHLVAFADFYDRFRLSLPPEEVGNWTRIKVSRALPLKFESGTHTGNKTYLINASWEPCTAPVAPYTIRDGKVRKAD